MRNDPNVQLFHRESHDTWSCSGVFTTVTAEGNLLDALPSPLRDFPLHAPNPEEDVKNQI